MDRQRKVLSRYYQTRINIGHQDDRWVELNIVLGIFRSKVVNRKLAFYRLSFHTPFYFSICSRSVFQITSPHLPSSLPVAHKALMHYLHLSDYIISIYIGQYKGPSWSWSYSSWIYNYLWNQGLSPLKLWVLTPFMARCTRNNMWWSLSVTCDRSVVFAGYSDFLHQ